MYNEEDYLLLSGIQHYAFCPRQWALIHIEEQWRENHLTCWGRILHRNAHEGQPVEKRGDMIIFRGLRVHSSVLGITGTCDVVEFYKSDTGITLNGYSGLWDPFPVEYKRGKTKPDDCDRLQLCAQAVCLEDMLCANIVKGAIFYGQPRRRELVNFSTDLRLKLKETVTKMHDIYKRRHTPRATKAMHCKSCSLKDLCLPNLGDERQGSVRKYLEMHVK